MIFSLFDEYCFSIHDYARTITNAFSSNVYISLSAIGKTTPPCAASPHMGAFICFYPFVPLLAFNGALSSADGSAEAEREAVSLYFPIVC